MKKEKRLSDRKKGMNAKGWTIKFIMLLCRSKAKGGGVDLVSRYEK